MGDRISQQEIPVDEWAPAEVGELDLYQKREKIYTRAIEGFYQKIRVFTGWPLLLGYFCLPWLDWFGRQSVLFDLPARKFHILWFTFWPQDMSLLGLLLIICAYSLFLVTSIAGRVWCGFTCPQTVWTSIFTWLEQKTEGTRNQRIKLDAAPWSVVKARKKIAKHFLWFGFAFLTGFTFVGYFVPIKSLLWDFMSFEVAAMPLFWVLFFSFATYANAGWMREQVCKYMCPYARFQSSMFDKDTLIVSYDAQRGEPRGSRKRDDNYREKGLGDCVDCSLCVQVCPTGIDIRNGLQYECIACGMCVDACNSIMEKLHYPKNLIAFTTARTLVGDVYRLLRPKTIMYFIVLIAMVSVFVWRIVSLEHFEVTVIRDRAQVTSINSSGLVENRYLLKIVNKTDQPQRFTIALATSEGFQLQGMTTPTLEPSEVQSLRLRVVVDAKQLKQTVTPIEFIVADQLGETYRHDSRFIGEVN